MAFTDTAGQSSLRGQYFDEAVKGIAPKLYKFKQAVDLKSTTAWTNFFWREDPTVLTGISGAPIRGVPRLAAFPTASQKYERVQAVLQKYAFEDVLPWEDIKTDGFRIDSRTAFKVAEGVVNAVDSAMYSGLTENGAPTNINTFVASYAWSGASGAIINDLLIAQRLISTNNYPTSDLMCFVSPKDKQSIMNYLAEKGAQFPSIATDVTLNGSIGKLVGMDLIESVNVTASQALVVVPKRCAQWIYTTPLTTTTIEDPYKSTTYRAVEDGVLALTDPLAVVLIRGTQ